MRPSPVHPSPTFAPSSSSVLQSRPTWSAWGRTAALGAGLLASGWLAEATPVSAAPSKLAQIVEKALTAQEQAWNRGDLDGFLGFYLPSESLTCVSGGRVLTGFDPLRQRYAERYGAKGTVLGNLHFDDLRMQDLGEQYVLSIGHFKLERQGAATEGVFTLVWQNTPQGPKILSDHRSITLGTSNEPKHATSGSGGEAASSTPGDQGSKTPGEAAKGTEAAKGASLRTLRGGLQVEDLTVGTGEPALTAQWVQVHYTGWLADGRKFDSSLDRGQPFEFQLGQRQVIPGWDEGVVGMRVGGKRRLVIPPGMAYGARGVPGAIPPNATLTFDVELLALIKPRP